MAGDLESPSARPRPMWSARRLEVPRAQHRVTSAGGTTGVFTAEARGCVPVPITCRFGNAVYRDRAQSGIVV